MELAKDLIADVRRLDDKSPPTPRRSPHCATSTAPAARRRRHQSGPRCPSAGPHRPGEQLRLGGRRGRLRDADPSFGSRVARPAAGRRTHYEQRRPGPRHRPHQSRTTAASALSPPTRATLQDLVGGYIEAVYGYCGPDGADHDDLRITFCVNEEGEIHNLPVNRLATELWWHYDRRASAYRSRGSHS